MEIWVWAGAIAVSLGIVVWALGYLFTRARKLFRSFSTLADSLRVLEQTSREIPEIVRPVSSIGADPVELIVTRMRMLRAKREQKRERERRLIKRLLSR